MLSRHRGFTLIELLVVMAIVAVLSGVGVAYSGTYLSRRRLEGAAFELVQDLRQTQATATFRRQTLKITFDVAGNNYVFEKEPGGTTVRRDFSSAIGYASVVSGATGTGSSVDFGSVKCPTSSVADLYFGPQGTPVLDRLGNDGLTVDEGAIVLSSRDGQTIKVLVSKVLGRIRMEWQ
ncbi:prepilin-type N-terminal cleavage/methylation domain-containing protein [Candidatus Cryosericum septentrionale]|uniref:prepilin-type N-terminal cleavage/methylation domain-containing protein n=1 Tax=Candidatus Cryosericum septentrionale TaxID=2290913 RepID=UPI001403CA4A|nr:prepilin-type N-terminal cleavage/methylation domain-containing protein [Candidatus Cryosericum septentrionale]